jgi:hypothetical protein
MGDINEGVANILQPAKKYTKEKVLNDITLFLYFYTDEKMSVKSNANENILILS